MVCIAWRGSTAAGDLCARERPVRIAKWKLFNALHECQSCFHIEPRVVVRWKARALTATYCAKLRRDMDARFAMGRLADASRPHFLACTTCNILNWADSAALDEWMRSRR